MADFSVYSTNNDIDIDLLKNQLENAVSVAVKRITPGPPNTEVVFVDTLTAPQEATAQSLIDTHVNGKDPTKLILAGDVVAENLTVTGTETTVNTEILDTNSNILGINTDEDPDVFAGIRVYRGANPDAYMGYDDRPAYAPAGFKLGTDLSSMSLVVTENSLAGLDINRSQIVTGLVTNAVLFNDGSGDLSESTQFLWDDSTNELIFTPSSGTASLVHGVRDSGLVFDPDNTRLLLKDPTRLTFAVGAEYFTLISSGLQFATPTQFDDNSTFSGNVSINGATSVLNLGNAAVVNGYLNFTSLNNGNISANTNLILTAATGIELTSSYTVLGGQLYLGNDKALWFRNFANTAWIEGLHLRSDNTLELNTASAAGIIFKQNGVAKWYFDSGFNLIPAFTGVCSLGDTTHRLTSVFADNIEFSSNVRFSNVTTTGTASSGAATLPANPVGFINLILNGMSGYRIPYYNA